MGADGQGTWEQPDFEGGLDAIAVDLITSEVRRVFAGLDPEALVAAKAPGLAVEDRRLVAELIDSALVEVDVDFSGCAWWRP